MSAVAATVGVLTNAQSHSRATIALASGEPPALAIGGGVAGCGSE
jgi:hypothetical protein